MSNLSVLILTRNEEINLPACLGSVSWSDDVHVYDSMSTDRTVQIAKDFGATLTQRDWGEGKMAFGGDEATHRNWALANIPFKNAWVLNLDADERANPELVQEMLRAIESSEHAAYRIRRRDYLGSTWLRHVQASPFYVRLFQPDKIRYERIINFNVVVDGSIGQLSGYFDHFPFSKGIADWVAKHNDYSTLEAQQIVADRRGGKTLSLLKAVASRDFHVRRLHQKDLFYRMPFRPLLKFLVLYIGKAGFLDGRAGFTYARLQSTYEYFIVLKTREIESQEGQAK
jgi:glycosyltransferase involved in cell wall biosynthesis